MSRRKGGSRKDTLDDTTVAAARGQLDELYDHHLITEPGPGRFLLHDLIREYARALAAAGEAADGRAASGRLVNYYAHVAAAASEHIATWTTAGGRPPPGSPPASAQLATGDDGAAWLDAERPNLHAAVGFAAQTKPLHAIAIATAMGGFLRARGHWDRAADQYRTALSAVRRAGEAGALDELGLLQQLTGDYPAATATLSRAASLYRDLGDRTGQACTLNHLGLVQQDTGESTAPSTRSCYPASAGTRTPRPTSSDAPPRARRHARSSAASSAMSPASCSSSSSMARQRLDNP